MKFRLITAVWGSLFVENFCRYTLRTLIAPGNAIDLAARHQVTYSIFTRKEDMGTITASPAYSHLRSRVNITIEPVNKSDIGDAPSTHWRLWRRGAARAARNGEIVILVIPDLLYASGTFMQWASLFEQGYRCVFVPAVQVAAETIYPDIDRTYSSKDLALEIDNSELQRLLLEHLHPVHVSMFRSFRRGVPHPEYVLWPVPGEGFILRELTSQPFCVDPNYFALSAAFSPKNRLDKVAFAECSAISVEPLFKLSDFYFRTWDVDEDRWSNLGGWSASCRVPAHLLESRHDFVFRFPGSSDKRGFRAASRSADFLIGQLDRAHSIYQIWRQLRHLQCTESASLLAVAVYAGRLRRRFIVSGPFTAFIPVNSAFSDQQKKEALCAAGNEELLIATIKAHVTPGQLRLNVGTSLTFNEVTATGENPRVDTYCSNVELTWRSAEHKVAVVAGPHVVGDCTIYLIDGLIALPPPIRKPDDIHELSWDTIEPSIPEPSSDTIEPSVSLEQTSVTLEPGPSSVGRWSFLSKDRPRTANLFSKERLRTAAKRAVVKLVLPLPVVGPLTVKAHAALRRREEARRRHEEALRRGEDARCQREEALRQGKEAVRQSEEERRRSEIDRAAAVRLVGLQRQMNLLATCSMLERFERTVLPAQYRSKPLALLTEIKSSKHIDAATIEASLRQLTAEVPDCGEALIELGEIELARGELEEAAANFSKAADARSILKPDDDKPMRGWALNRHASILASMERFPEAIASIQRAIATGSYSTMLLLKIGKLLRKAGRPLEALWYIDMAMEYDGMRQRGPGFPSPMTGQDFEIPPDLSQRG